MSFWEGCAAESLSFSVTPWAIHKKSGLAPCKLFVVKGSRAGYGKAGARLAYLR